MPAQDLETLRAFRTALHRCYRRRADALSELGDALLTVEAVTSLPQMSLQPPHRRDWGSLYDALGAGCLDVEALRAMLAQHPATDRQPAYAVDLSVWPRCDAEASPARGYYYHPSRHSAGHAANTRAPVVMVYRRVPAFLRGQEAVGFTEITQRSDPLRDGWEFLVGGGVECEAAATPIADPGRDSCRSWCLLEAQDCSTR